MRLVARSKEQVAATLFSLAIAYMLLVVVAALLGAVSATHPAVHTFLNSVSSEPRERAASVISTTISAPPTRVCLSSSSELTLSDFTLLLHSRLSVYHHTSLQS